MGFAKGVAAGLAAASMLFTVPANAAGWSQAEKLRPAPRAEPPPPPSGPNASCSTTVGSAAATTTPRPWC